MNSVLFRAAVICGVAILLVSGCTQPDGPNPQAEDDVPNRLADLARDVESVAAGEADAAADLADDLVVFVGGADLIAAARGLSGKFSAAVAGHQVTESQAQQLANDLWFTVAATEYNARQVSSLQTHLKDALLDIGVPAAQAEAVASEVPTVQALVNKRPKRWYEFF